MIDWNKLTLQPAISRLGSLLREQFGVWVGFVDADGAHHPIGGEHVPLHKPACTKLAATSALSNQSEGQRTCAQSLRRWATAEEDEDPVEASCHAGFSSMLFRLDAYEGADQCCLYVSGYVRSELAHRALGEIRETLETAEFFADDGDESEEAIDAIPRLDRKDRSFMRTVGKSIVEEVGRLLSADEPDDDVAINTPGESFHGMVGTSRQVLDLFETIRIIAGSNSTVLIQGENGTGKELIARALHLESHRKDAPFVALNCAAIPGDLIASELFGHRKGAFSGAHRDRIGLLQEADGGTLFLDEIGDMDLHLQVKLLRFLQEGTYMPVGGNTVRKVDVRVLCATNQDLQALVRQGQFRKDLFFRINVINLMSPPLRRRRADIEVLANHFLSAAAKRHNRPLKRLSEECLSLLQSHEWPGNVRELENEIERLVIMSGDDEVIDAMMLSQRINPQGEEPDFPLYEDMELPDAIEQLERTMILQGLRETGWNKSQTARNLGVSRRNLIRKVSQYELERFRDD
ncbi:sigma-54-dependent Fis family transcriptional regulator [Persicimonas caeni]|uniref:Sigma-54-dependent Fis family transcriptional regulator n=1 Tax=Persicimonas caeni TaxID=2292766 RepID=A0A4Y6Q406_PERCE|nr:sigma-54 dependent transcriptional regulator [Persicimonas caeni]QDG54715.1 sigma-54-dependent Fis family transcriptional regulator [Persicimonas caeni]QED35936.1 sigma-54-dependent Fis family transcriptional regulator [Persicimonas caeni]